MGWGMHVSLRAWILVLRGWDGVVGVGAGGRGGGVKGRGEAGKVLRGRRSNA